MSYTIEKAAQIFPDTRSADVVPAISARFDLLSAEDQLALIWYAYLEMGKTITCLLYTSPSPRDQRGARMPSSA